VKRARYLLLNAESALEAGEPLHAALSAAAGAAGDPSEAERGLLARLQQGQLEEPLRALGFSPVAARAAAIDARVAGPLQARLRQLPDAAALAKRATAPVLYLALVFAMQALAVTIIGLFAGPSMLAFERGLAPAPVLLLRACGAVAPGALLAVLVAGVAARIALPKVLFWSFWNARAAEVCAAAAALLRAGTQPSASLPRLLEVAADARERLQPLLGDGGLDAASLDSRADSLGAAALADAERRHALLWAGGMAVAIVIGLLLMYGVYGAIAYIPSAGSME
jgi:hypothetical protein